MIASRDALLVALAAGEAARHPGRQGLSIAGMVQEAQEIAAAACDAWGHVDDAFTCARCGKKSDEAARPARRFTAAEGAALLQAIADELHIIDGNDETTEDKVAETLLLTAATRKIQALTDGARW